MLAGRLATRAVRQSGLGDLSPAQLSRYLDGISAAAQPFIGETTQGVTGSSSTADVETMFQLMHLLFTEPRVGDQAFAEVVNVGEIILNLSQVDPGWKAWVAYNQARYGDEFEWFNPAASQETLDALTAESLLETLQAAFCQRRRSGRGRGRRCRPRKQSSGCLAPMWELFLQVNRTAM